jgi:hypothetical protein
MPQKSLQGRIYGVSALLLPVPLVTADIRRKAKHRHHTGFNNNKC